MSRDSFCSVAPVDTGTTAEGQHQRVEDPPTMSSFTWTIEHFSRLHPKKAYSDVFTVDGYKWRVSIFPKGNNVDHLSMYLDVADSAALPYGWSRYALFSLSVINQKHRKHTVRKETQHKFNARESDWGFTSFMPLCDLHDPSRGYIVNDTCIVEAEVDVHKGVHFRALEKPKEDSFCLELSKLFTYDDVVERVARQLGLDDPSKIRLTSHNCVSQQPKPHPIKYRGVERLSDMLVHDNQTSDILYYEVLDIPLPELQCLKTLNIAFHHATKDEVVIYTIRLPKNSTVGDVINDLKTKVELSHPNAELRLLQIFYHKIYKIFPATEKVENINDQYWTLRAEEIPEEEKNLGPHDRLIHVYHLMNDPNQNQMQVQNFGEPFFLVIHEGETLAEVKARIQKKLHVPDEEFSKWKFAFLFHGQLEYLQDPDVVSSRFQGIDVYGSWEQYLGLEHSETTPKEWNTNQNRHTFEKPVMAAPSSSHFEEISHVVTTAPPENTPSAKAPAVPPASIPTTQTTATPVSDTKGGPTTVMAAPDDKDKQMRESFTLSGSASSPIPPEYERFIAVHNSSLKFQCLEDGRRGPSYHVGDNESVFMDCTTALKLAENSLLCNDHSALKKVPYERLVNTAVWYSQMLSSVNAEMRHRTSSMSALELALSQKLQASENVLEDTKARLEAALLQIYELNKLLAEEKAARNVAEEKVIAAEGKARDLEGMLAFEIERGEEKVIAAEGKARDIEGMLAIERERGEEERSSLRSQINALFDKM